MEVNEFVPVKNLQQLQNINTSSDKKEQSSDSDSDDINFGSLLKQKLDALNEKQISADDVTESFIKGDETDIHKVMLETEEAKMDMELAVQIRNKMVEAYQELNKMQL